MEKMRRGREKLHTHISPVVLLFPLLFLLFGGAAHCYDPPQIPDRFTAASVKKPLRSEPDEAEPIECIDPTPPSLLPTDESPSCSLLLLQQDFGHTVGTPPAAANYTAPENCRWTKAVLEFSASCSGEQSDRIAAVWLDGVELLRTSTAKPTEAGVFWTVRKDITRYGSLLQPLPDQSRRKKTGALPRLLTVMLENAVTELYTGIYHVNITLDFFGHATSDDQESGLGLGLNTLPEPPQGGGGGVPYNPRYVKEQIKLNHLLGRPSDMVIPISNDRGKDEGFWFKIEKEADVRKKGVRIPKNTFKAVLEIYVSFHGDDEFWYTNPPDSYNQQNNLPSRRGNWAFREVFATIDGLYAGSLTTFPVMFPGGINPMFWSPVVAIKAFDLPSYDLDVTPFIGALLTGRRPHRVGLHVGCAIPYWLISANLHVWVDPHVRAVSAMLVKHHVPPTFVSRNANNKFLDGHFQLEAGRQARFEGWVKSSFGNFTTLLDTNFKYKSSVEYKFQGTLKEVYSQSKNYVDVRITEFPNQFLARVIRESDYPFHLVATNQPWDDEGFAYMKSNLSHVMYESTDVTLTRVRSQTSVTNRQVAGGWVKVRNRSVLSGSANTFQTYMRRDNGRCHTRRVSVRDGDILADGISTDCNMRDPVPEELTPATATTPLFTI